MLLLLVVPFMDWHVIHGKLHPTILFFNVEGCASTPSA